MHEAMSVFRLINRQIHRILASKKVVSAKVKVNRQTALA
jgi:hypothetical protein